MDLINDINYNKEFIYKNKNYTLNNLLIKANYMTISIGMDDLIYRQEINYNYIDELIDDIEKLLVLIRKYNKDKIYFLSLYKSKNISKFVKYANKKIKKICEENKIDYVDISKLDKINNKNKMYISDKIINFTNK